MHLLVLFVNSYKEEASETAQEENKDKQTTKCQFNHLVSIWGLSFLDQFKLIVDNLCWSSKTCLIQGLLTFFLFFFTNILHWIFSYFFLLQGFIYSFRILTYLLRNQFTMWVRKFLTLMPNFTTTRTTCLVKFCCPHGCWARLTLESVSVVKFFVSADSCLRGHILIIICSSYPYETVTLHYRLEYNLWPHMSISVIWIEQVCTNGVYFVSEKLVSIVNFQNFVEVYMV